MVIIFNLGHYALLLSVHRRLNVLLVSLRGMNFRKFFPFILFHLCYGCLRTFHWEVWLEVARFTTSKQMGSFSFKPVWTAGLLLMGLC